jgi:hypothetical protein
MRARIAERSFKNAALEPRPSEFVRVARSVGLRCNACAARLDRLARKCAEPLRAPTADY